MIWALALAVAVFTAAPALGARLLAGRVAPRVLAVTHTLALLGWAVLPLGLVGCAGARLAGLGTHGALVAGCRPGLGHWAGTAVAAAVAAAVLLRAGAVLARGVRAGRRLDVRRHLVPGARPRRVGDGGEVWVVPTPALLAYSAGWSRPCAVVSTGLLALLDPAEQEAVLVHEAAHSRLAHPRLLLLASCVQRCYGWLPPVQATADGLRRELEAIADDAAAAAVGAAPLAGALARVSAAGGAGGSCGAARAGTRPDPVGWRGLGWRGFGWRGFGSVGVTSTGVGPAGAGRAAASGLAYRLGRLLAPRRRAGVAPVALAGLTTAALGAALAWAACTTVVPSPTLAGLLACLVSAAVLTWAAGGARFT